VGEEKALDATNEYKPMRMSIQGQTVSKDCSCSYVVDESCEDLSSRLGVADLLPALKYGGSAWVVHWFPSSIWVTSVI